MAGKTNDLERSKYKYDLLPLFDKDMNNQSKNPIGYDIAIDSARIFFGVTVEVLKHSPGLTSRY